MPLANTINRYRITFEKTNSFGMSNVGALIISNWTDIADLAGSDLPGWTAQIEVTCSSDTNTRIANFALYDQFGGAVVTGSNLSVTCTTAGVSYTGTSSAFSLLSAVKDLMLAVSVNDTSTVTVTSYKLILTRTGYASITGLGNTLNELVLDAKRFPIHLNGTASSSFVDIGSALTVSPKYYRSAFSKAKVSFTIGNASGGNTNHVYWKIIDQSGNTIVSGDTTLAANTVSFAVGWELIVSNYFSLSGVTSLKLQAYSADSRQLYVSVATLLVKEV